VKTQGVKTVAGSYSASAPLNTTERVGDANGSFSRRRYATPNSYSYPTPTATPKPTSATRYTGKELAYHRLRRQRSLFVHGSADVREV